VDCQNLRDRLAPLRTRWDLAVLANLADSDGSPADLIKAINAQSSDGQISWKVLEAGLRRLETAGYVSRGKCCASRARPGTGCSSEDAG
jgi:DNA-binding HxlR family transcriptional regulator